jgi:hypothetical protein
LEAQVLDGKSLREIGTEHSISKDTVRSEIKKFQGDIQSETQLQEGTPTADTRVIPSADGSKKAEGQ